jgi:hypothetical protein
MDSFGLATAGSVTTLTDTTKNWAINQWAGKRGKIIAGTGQGQEFTITSNTATVLTVPTLTTAPSTDSLYVLLGMQLTGAGVALEWAYGNSVAATKGMYLWIPQGGATSRIQRFNLCQEVIDYGLAMTPQSETFSTGTQYAYDYKDRLIVHQFSGRTFTVNVNTLHVDGSGTIPYAHATALTGNRMEISVTTDGLLYLYLMRETAQEFWRTLLFW